MWTDDDVAAYERQEQRYDDDSTGTVDDHVDWEEDRERVRKLWNEAVMDPSHECHAWAMDLLHSISYYQRKERGTA